MSLSPWDVLAKNVPALREFFTDILRHLDARNYRNGVWTPEATGLTAGKTARPISIVVDVGSLIAGDVNSLQEHNAEVMRVEEVSGAPGFNIKIHFSGMVAYPGELIVWGRYEGNAAHQVELQMYNYDTLRYDYFTGSAGKDFPSGSEEEKFTFTNPTMTNYVSAGTSRIALYHVSSGTAGHNMHLNELKFEFVGGSYALTGRYQRLGRDMRVDILITGSHVSSGGEITNLPEIALDYGTLSVNSLTLKKSLGTATIQKGTKTITLPDYTDSGDTVMVSGNYPVTGI